MRWMDLIVRGKCREAACKMVAKSYVVVLVVVVFYILC